MIQAPDYTGGEIQPDLDSNPLDKWTPKAERPGQPINAAMCKPGDVRFVHEEVNLAGGAGPTDGQVIASIEPQSGLTYEGVWLRWGCPYPWLVQTGVVTVRVMTREKTPYPLAEFNQQPDEPIWLPWCQQGGSALEVRAFWTDATVTTFTQIPFWAEFALGTSDAPSFDDDNANRVRRRIADVVPIVVLPGAAFASISPAIIRVTAGELYMQISPTPAPGPPVAGQPQFTFATIRGGGPGNIAGSLNPQGLPRPTRIEVDDLRDVFLGDPLTTGAAPMIVNIHREVWA